ncbi:MAG: hypothetical protein KBD63_07770, partial [Bacteriovoracaceae bacterium]|nr:hypothetical protein [Bacteriovoracaceae bacterium]
MQNNQGNITLIGMFLLLLLSSYSLFAIMIWQKNSKNIYIRLKTYECFHQLTLFTQNYIQHIHELNRYIKITQTVKNWSGMIPVLSGVSSSAKAAQEILKTMQNAKHFSFLKKIAEQENRLCQGKWSFAKSPYVTQGIFLGRKQDQTVPLRGSQWNVFLKGPDFTLHGYY